MRKATLLFFWDYDTHWGADRSRSPGGPKQWGQLEFENTETLLELHAEHNIPACFAVVGAAALPGSRPYHDPDQIRRIHAAGHEVASHSHRHEWLPGLDRRELLATLQMSKDSLEQCIGADVVSFVPPYNQPFDYAAKWAFSVSERYQVRGERTDLKVLCETLWESGYRFCRVAYKPLPVQIAERITGRMFERPASFENIAGVQCIRLNTPGGFHGPTRTMLNRCVKNGATVVIYGHPHSIRMHGPQHVSHLTTLLSEIRGYRERGELEVKTPSSVVKELTGTASSLAAGNLRECR